MTDIAIHIRIFCAQPSDELVAKRTKAIRELCDSFKKRSNSNLILQLAADIATGIQRRALAGELREHVARAISKHSTAFVADGNELELLTC